MVKDTTLEVGGRTIKISYLMGDRFLMLITTDSDIIEVTLSLEELKEMIDILSLIAR